MVEVFPLHVDHQRQFWLKQGERATGWFSIKKAASLVSEPGLREILLHFDPRHQASDGPETSTVGRRFG
jgi:hypothetical protein